MKRELLREYFNFSKRERQGMAALLALIAVCRCVPLVWEYCVPMVIPMDSTFKTEVESFRAELLSAQKTDTQISYIRYSYFDPNALTAQEWQKLGVSARTAQTIQHYLAKGGKFRRKEDLQKIYGLRPELYEQLAPYVRIADGGKAFVHKTGEMQEARGMERVQNRQEREAWSAYGIQHKRGEPGGVQGTHEAPGTQHTRRAPYCPPSIDINTADSAAWEALPGIGPTLASRIVKFREKLGGFYTITQIGETFGLRDSTFKKIQPFLQLHDVSLKKIDLNNMDEKSLAQHPYIRYKLARLIVLYRSNNGPFSRPEDLRRIPLVDDSIYRKLEHYIK